ncbi:hypothetical protein BDW62DRAFT_119382 [Aspergillus aurantiobrunneus]
MRSGVGHRDDFLTNRGENSRSLSWLAGAQGGEAKLPEKRRKAREGNERLGRNVGWEDPLVQNCWCLILRGSRLLLRWTTPIQAKERPTGLVDKTEYSASRAVEECGHAQASCHDSLACGKDEDWLVMSHSSAVVSLQAVSASKFQPFFDASIVVWTETLTLHIIERGVDKSTKFGRQPGRSPF